MAAAEGPTPPEIIAHYTKFVKAYHDKKGCTICLGQAGKFLIGVVKVRYGANKIINNELLEELESYLAVEKFGGEDDEGVHHDGVFGWYASISEFTALLGFERGKLTALCDAALESVATAKTKVKEWLTKRKTLVEELRAEPAWKHIQCKLEDVFEQAEHAKGNQENIFSPPYSDCPDVSKSKTDYYDELNVFDSFRYPHHSHHSLSFDGRNQPLIHGEYNDVSGSGSSLLIGGVVGASAVVIIVLIFCLGLAFGMAIYWGYSQKRALNVQRKKGEMRNWIDNENNEEV
eukprot:611190_1